MDFEVGCRLTGTQILGGQAPQISEWQMDEVHLDLERFWGNKQNKQKYRCWAVFLFLGGGH